MTKLTRYEEAFWGPEFAGTAGFDVLSSHNNEQKKCLQEFEEYLRKRAKIETEYSTSIGKLCKSIKEQNVVGILDKAWKCLKMELDSLRQTHETAASFFQQHAEDTKRFQKDLTARRDAIEDRVKRVQNQKNSQYQRVQALYKNYSGKCRDQDLAKDLFATLRHQVTCTVKELEKAQSRATKSVDEAMKADTAYKAGIHTLEDLRMEWEKEMEQACRDFQDSDEEQICFLRSEMWETANRDSQVALDMDESSERVRQILEQCDVEQDITSFITINTTGTQRPEKVLYQNYYNNVPNSGGGQPSPNNNRASDPQQRQPVLPPTTAPSVDTGILFTLDEDPTYSTIQAPARMLTVTRSYTSQEITVRPGDKVKFMRQVAANMYEVQTAENKCGKLPATCVQ